MKAIQNRKVVGRLEKLKKDMLASKGQKTVIGNEQATDTNPEEEDDEEAGLEEADFKQLMADLKIKREK